MSVDDPIFNGCDSYGKDARSKGDFGDGVFKNGSKPIANTTKVSMDKSSGKAGKKVEKD